METEKLVRAVNKLAKEMDADFSWEETKALALSYGYSEEEAEAIATELRG